MMESGGYAPPWVSKPKQKRRVLVTATGEFPTPFASGSHRRMSRLRG